MINKETMEKILKYIKEDADYLIKTEVGFFVELADISMWCRYDISTPVIINNITVDNILNSLCVKTNSMLTLMRDKIVLTFADIYDGFICNHNGTAASITEAKEKCIEWIVDKM